ncbi:MAG: tetratricopeptide repeat protein [Thiohalobacteraceae bacterium]
MRVLQLGLIALLSLGALPISAAALWTEVYRERLEQAQQGSADAQFDIAAMHENGRGVSADRARALEWYRAAANQGHSRAEKALLRMDENERRFEKTAAQARSGDTDAQYNLGNMYLTATGTTIDLKLAEQWLKRAANAGQVKAQFKLGHLYYVGLGDDSDADAAFEWFSKAAESNYPSALYYLGEAYATGAGVVKDYQTSRSWYERARDAGFGPARQALRLLDERIAQAAAQETAAAQLAQQEAERAAAKPLSGATTTAAPSPAGPQDLLKRVQIKKWYTGTRPAQFLPSGVSDCNLSADSLICYSRELAHKDQPQVNYKVKSIIRRVDGGEQIRIVYREFVLPTQMDASETDADTAAEGAIQPGWQAPHNLGCKFSAAERLTCTLDSGIVAEFRGS